MIKRTRDVQRPRKQDHCRRQGRLSYLCAYARRAIVPHALCVRRGGGARAQ